ncbi:MAG: right-handed parallel beta-helix repeat-containing protein [bacterium]|nr:right-handed parallel beta-helix repeat-containing protein [Labilithrix sp.]MCW5834484.1 right-handed parallel beta-helix repeat-containing protein [Labilithrix sp.]MCW5893352.1 right-handed parallel beta-helix repeat-containing protein [bacterium]
MVRTPLLPVALLSWSVLFAAAATGCSSDDDEGALAPPDGVSCASVAGASDESSLVSGLANVGAGGCVVLTGSVTSSVPIVIDGVTLVGAKGTRPVLTAAPGTGGAITVTGDGSQLGNLDVTGARGVGVAIVARDVKVFDVVVSGAEKAAVAVVPGSEGASSATLTDVVLEKNAYGLYVGGAGVEVTMSGGRVSENGGSSLSAGAGVVTTDGAKLTLDGVTVEKNEGTGVLLDGASTRAVIAASTISENRERGVWAQGLQGTLDAPALRIEETELSKNRIVGMGGIALKGIIIVGGSVKETVASPVPTNLAATELIGDGVGIFGGSTDFKIERTNFAANGRAAGVVDGSEVGIIIVGGKVEPGDSGLKFVVQNSKADVQIPDADKSTTTSPLGISAPKIQVPSAL